MMGAGNQPTGIVTSVVTGSTVSGVSSKATPTPVILSPYAEEVARVLKFDREVLIIAKEESQDRIGRLVGYDDNDYQIIAPGILVSVPEDRTDRVLASLRKRLLPLKYMAFLVEMNGALKIDKIGVLKGTDQYEILRIMHTDGTDYDISNQDVIDRLKEWEKIASFDIIGADSDWVEIEFKKLPKNLKSFAEEVYDFCPDAIDQGPGTIEGLVKDIVKTNRLFLWWD
jgi:hypothetical protein